MTIFFGKALPAVGFKPCRFSGRQRVSGDREATPFLALDHQVAVAGPSRTDRRLSQIADQAARQADVSAGPGSVSLGSGGRPTAWADLRGGPAPRRRPAAPRLLPRRP